MSRPRCPGCKQKMRYEFNGPAADQDEPGIKFGIRVVCDNPKCYCRQYDIGGSSYADAHMRLNTGLEERRRKFKAERVLAGTGVPVKIGGGDV